MNKENLHSALLLLMNKLEEVKDNPMQDKRFVAALMEVLRYFRDNGELREAYELHKIDMELLEKSSWGKLVMTMCHAKMDEFGTEIPPIDIKESIEWFNSENISMKKSRTFLAK